jgi:O-Antigen ligase
MLNSPQALTGARARRLGFAAVWFIAAMATPTTARFALPLLAVGTLIAAMRGELDLESDLDAIEWGLLLFALAWIASAACGIDPGRSFRLSIPMLAALTALFVLRRQREAAPALMSFDVALFLLGFWQCLQLTRPLLSGLSGEAAIQQSNAMWLVEPNDIAWIAATWPPMLAVGSSRQRALCAVPVALALVLMILLGSRLALIVSVLALAPMLTRSPLRMLGLALMLSIVFALAALLLDPAIFAKGSASLASRAQLWRTAGQVFYDWPWLGTGPHGFELAYRQYLPDGLALDARDTPWPHSLPLEIAAVTGLAGIFATGSLVFTAILHCRTEQTPDADRRRVLVVQCLVFALLGLFEASFLRLWVWMLAIAILGRLPRHARATQDFSLTKGGNQ